MEGWLSEWNWGNHIKVSISNNTMTFWEFLMVPLTGSHSILVCWRNKVTKDTCLSFFPSSKSFWVSSSQFPRLLCTRLNSSIRLVTRLERESAFCLILFASTCESPKMKKPYFLLTRCHTSLPRTCHHCLRTTIQTQSPTEIGSIPHASQAACPSTSKRILCLLCVFYYCFLCVKITVNAFCCE